LGVSPLTRSTSRKDSLTSRHYNPNMLRAIVFIMLAAVPLLAQSDDAILQHLRADFVKHSRLLRGFYQDALLHYDSGGKLTHRAETGSWTTSFFKVESLDVKKGRLELRGTRAVQTFNDKKRIFELHPTDVKLAASIDAAPPLSEEDLRAALASVFVDPKESMSQMLPDSWRWVLDHLDKDGVLPKPEKNAVIERKPCPADASVDQPCRVGGEVKPPKPIHTPDPAFNDYGREFHLTGTTILWTVVDETGHTQKLHIEKPLGCGMDEHALEKVHEWRFEPATRDGKPVPVMINIEVNYRWN
jgi:Gram-negative bacterial TonB protein C-terminal